VDDPEALNISISSNISRIRNKSRFFTCKSYISSARKIGHQEGIRTGTNKKSFG
jgi:hypothetical protein